MPTHCELMEWDRDYWPLRPHTLTIVCNTYMMLGILALTIPVCSEQGETIVPYVMWHYRLRLSN